MKYKQVWHEMIQFIKFISKDSKKVIVALLIGAWAKATAPFLSLYFSSKMLNHMIIGNYEKVMQSISLLLLTQLVAGILEKVCYQIINALRETCEKSVAQRLSKKAFELEYEVLEKQETMDQLRRTKNSTLGSGGIGEQIRVCYDILTRVFAIMYSLIFMGILFFRVDSSAKSFFTSYGATILLISIYTVIIVLNSKMGKKAVQLMIDMQHDNDHINAVGNYSIVMMLNQKNAKDIRIFKMQNNLIQKFNDICQETLGIYVPATAKAGQYYSVNSMINQLAAGCSFIFVGAKAIYGLIGVGDILLYAGAINRVISNMTELESFIYDFSYRASYLKSYETFLNGASMSYDGTLPIEKRDDAQYEFELHDVSFSYPDTKVPVLNHVSLKFNIGEKMALVGRNGAGKSTLIKLLCRLYEPTEGFITLNGIDIRKYNYKEYTRIFSVVFQDFNLFSLPLSENVAAGQDVDEEKLEKVLEEVNLKERVEKMEKGIHTRLYHNNGEGVDVSGGEAQRLAIARALYKDAPFVILDEPTAALDPISEAEIYENFNQMVQSKTAIYISHRMSSCKFCDKIVVLDQGEIAEMGSHQELLEGAGIYADLYETQAQYYA